MASKTPNIVWYCTDQQRFDTIGRLGNPYVHTPRIDQFMQEATVFTHAFVQCPICTPSRSSFLTGMHPSFLRANRNGNARFTDGADQRLITRILAEAGYDCGLTGKLHLAGAAEGPEPRADDGYRFFEYSHAPRRDYTNHTDYYQWIARQGGDPDVVLQRLDDEKFPRPPEDMYQGGLYEPTPDFDNAPPEYHQTTWCTEMAIDFVGEAEESGKPWLISLNPFDPHPPHDAPWEFYRRFDPNTLPEPVFAESDIAHQNKLAAAGIDFQSQSMPPEHWQFPGVKASYYAMIELIDEQFGRLLDFLEANDLRDNTIVIFTSDHGEMLGDHGLVLKGCRFYDPLVRVPLMISWPGHFEAGVISEALVEAVDIAPTLAEAAGLAMAEDTHGRSLLPILTGEAPLDEHRDFVRSEYHDAVEGDDESSASMYRDRRWKLVVYHGNEIGELYDLEADPTESHDLWDDPTHLAIKAELLQRSYDASIAVLDLGPDRIMMA